MAEETTKKPTTRKTKTTKKEVEKPVEETVVDMNAMAQQMQQMMTIMAQQQQMIAQLSQQVQAPKEVEEVVEEPKKQSRVRKTTNTGGAMTKQALRRKYKDTEIYLTSVFTGSVAYKGKTDTYIWEQYGDVQPMSIGDLIAMSNNPKYLENPWLVLDDYENDEEVLDDIITCFNLEKMYRRLYILQELEEDINGVDMTELQYLVEESNAKGGSLALDVTSIAQNKIISGDLENYRLIAEFEKIVGRTLNR